MLYLVNSD